MQANTESRIAESGVCISSRVNCRRLQFPPSKEAESSPMVDIAELIMNNDVDNAFMTKLFCPRGNRDNNRLQFAVLCHRVLNFRISPREFNFKFQLPSYLLYIVYIHRIPESRSHKNSDNRRRALLYFITAMTTWWPYIAQSTVIT